MDDLGPFGCQNSDGPDAGKRGHGNRTVPARYGPDASRRMLRCSTGTARFSERKGPPVRRSNSLDYGNAFPELNPDWLAGIVTGAGRHPTRGATAPAVRAGESIGTVIAGRYALIDLIGEGGMGSVYLARQSEPVRRDVALKLIKGGLDTKTVLARFDAERQALALMATPTSPACTTAAPPRPGGRSSSWNWSGACR